MGRTRLRGAARALDPRVPRRGVYFTSTVTLRMRPVNRVAPCS
jgi:hypothetical protein